MTIIKQETFRSHSRVNEDDMMRVVLDIPIKEFSLLRHVMDKVDYDKSVTGKDSQYYTEIKDGLKKIYLTWDGYTQAVKAFIAFLEVRGIRSFGRNASGIYGLPRGGSIFATHLSNILNLPVLAAPCDGCIIVEDIMDTGMQLQPLITKYIDKGTATLLCWVVNKERIPELKKYNNVFWAELKEPTDWVFFPWEVL